VPSTSFVARKPEFLKAGLPLPTGVFSRQVATSALPATNHHLRAALRLGLEVNRHRHRLQENGLRGTVVVNPARVCCRLSLLRLRFFLAIIIITSWSRRSRARWQFRLACGVARTAYSAFLSRVWDRSPLWPVEALKKAAGIGRPELVGLPGWPPGRDGPALFDLCLALRSEGFPAASISLPGDQDNSGAHASIPFHLPTPQRPLVPMAEATRGRASATARLRLGGRTWRVNRSRLQGLRVDRGADYGAGFS
jgi:hypothetical protein